MKIIAGQYRGRVIKTSDLPNFRPTTTKTREALFSILTSGIFVDELGNSVLENAQVLDLFCGSGSLGLEALSRGAATLLAIDLAQENIDLLKYNAGKLNVLEKVQTLKCDACLLPKCKTYYDVIFLDPPYYQNLVVKCLSHLKKKHWLKHEALIVAELEVQNKIEIPEGFKQLVHRVYGKTQIYILEYTRCE